MEEVGQRIKSAREQRGMSLKNLAERAGAHLSNLSCYENGKRTPALDLFIKIAQVLGVSTDYLLGGEDEGGLLLNDELRETIVKLQALNPRDRMIVAEIIRLCGEK